MDITLIMVFEYVQTHQIMCIKYVHFFVYYYTSVKMLKKKKKKETDTKSQVALVPLSGCNRTLQAKGLKNISHSSEGWESEDRVPAWSGSGEGPLLGVSSHGEEVSPLCLL